MYTRSLLLPKKSFILLGPRGCGKSTWLKTLLKEAPSVLRFDLLRNETFLNMQSNPSMLRELIEQKKPKWVIIDEIQKLPALLDEVHSMMEDLKPAPHFALTGSSARKLKRSHANLLAGRAASREMYPFTANELGSDFHLEKSLQWGNLPLVVNAPNSPDKIDVLESYVGTYLREEIQQETQLRSLASFHRFLGIAALMNGQKINFTNIASEAQVKRTTVLGYFEVLTDTLIASVLPAYQAKAKLKEVQTPKFYFFDTGVVNALKKGLRDSLSSEEKGFLLETQIYHELRAANQYGQWGAELFYWGTSNNEIDFVIKRGKAVFAIEVKYSSKWKPDFSKSLHVFKESHPVQRSFGVYTGKESFTKDGIEVYPVTQFLKEILPTLFKPAT